MHEEILAYISKYSDKQSYYLNGGCFEFYLLLRRQFGVLNTIPYTDEDHVITKIDGRFYDVTGEVQPELHYPMTRIDLERRYWYKEAK